MLTRRIELRRIVFVLAIPVIAVACAAPTAPTSLTISAQPQGQTIAPGGSATLNVAGAGVSPLTYQWYRGSKGTTTVPIAGATAPSYTTPALTTTTSYWVRVANAAATADSETATITVTAVAGTAPAIATQPQHQNIASGETAGLAVEASGTAPLAYQWFNGPSGTTSAPASGAAAPSYTTPALTATSSYWVRVSNAYGSVDSAAAVVTVAPPAPPPPDPASVFEDEVLVLVNQRRAAGATCGGTVYAPAPALYMHPNLRIAARGHSQDMATQNYVSHTSLDGRTFDQRIRNAGYTSSSSLAENIAAGQSTPQSVVAGWMSSPGHCANIMSGSYRALGAGYAFNPASIYRHYWTLDLGGS